MKRSVRSVSARMGDDRSMEFWERFIAPTACYNLGHNNELLVEGGQTLHLVVNMLTCNLKLNMQARFPYPYTFRAKIHLNFSLLGVLSIFEKKMKWQEGVASLVLGQMQTMVNNVFD